MTPNTDCNILLITNLSLRASVPTLVLRRYDFVCEHHASVRLIDCGLHYTVHKSANKAINDAE